MWNVIFYIPVLVIGVLSGMELPLFYRLAEGKRGLAKVLAYDYYGSLFAAVLFPIVLLPKFGLIGVSIMTGIVNLIIAYFMLRAGRFKRIYWVIVGILFVVLVALLINQSNLQENVNERFVSSVFRTEYKNFQDHFDLK